ncbi:unnamed protein product, partial [marine sediment metagenome]
FFDDVKVPKENLIGGKNQGWRQLMVSLNLERCWSRACMAEFARRILEDLVTYCRQTRRGDKSLAEDPLIRQRLAQIAIEIEVCRLFQYRVACMQFNKIIPEHESSVVKIFADELAQHLAKTAQEVLGPYGQLKEGSKWAPLAGEIEHLYLATPATTIAAGTSEIQRNIVASRGLKLPLG